MELPGKAVEIVGRDEIMSDVASEPDHPAAAEQRAGSGAPAPAPPARAAAVAAGGTGSAPNTLSETFLVGVMETFARMQEETNRTLMETLRALPRSSGPWDPPGSTPRSTASTPGDTIIAVGKGNFSKCSARFDGSSRDAEVLEAFIDAVQVFKECAGVSDEHALRGLPMLLAGDAAVYGGAARAPPLTAGRTPWHAYVLCTECRNRPIRFYVKSSLTNRKTPRRPKCLYVKCVR